MLGVNEKQREVTRRPRLRQRPARRRDRAALTHPSHDTLEEEEAPSNITNNDDGDDESGGGGGESCGVRRRGRPSPADLASQCNCLIGPQGE